jgi:hypothetical protein
VAPYRAHGNYRPLRTADIEPRRIVNIEPYRIQVAEPNPVAGLYFRPR